MLLLGDDKQPILDLFKKYGMNASYHYADDSGKEWVLGHQEKQKCLKIYNEHIELHPEMEEIAIGFLWSLKL